MDTSKTSRGLKHWLRVLRPLSWWFLMVLLMYAWRTHQRLSAGTTISFYPTLNGRDVGSEVNARLDDTVVHTGQRVSIGWHRLTVTHSKAKSFSRKLLVWYGLNDLGLIRLERTKGVLAVSAEPSAQKLSIRGPEFSVTLRNTSGMTSSVPTDRYVVEADYKHWKRQRTVTILADQTGSESFAPKFGTLRIESSHEGVTYQLRKGAREVVESGDLPATIDEVPEGDYQLVARRKEDEQEVRLAVKGAVTNDVKVQFVYGVAVLESDPPGATVASRGKEYGITPLVLPELKPGTFDFSLRLANYETTSGSLVVNANETNRYQTNLLRLDYTRAMAAARRSFAAKDYVRAAEASSQALKYKPADIEATDLQRESTGLAHLGRAEAFGQRGDYAGGITELNETLALLPDNAHAKELLARFTQREGDKIEAQKKRAADLAEQERKRREFEQARLERQERIKGLHKLFDAVGSRYENASAFVSHELKAASALETLASGITNALASGKPSFKIERDDSPSRGTKVIEARETISLGYRECLIVAGQVAENECVILFKVFEYEHPPKASLLGGLLNVTTSVVRSTTDPKVARQRHEEFQQRIKEGTEIVEKRIQTGIAQRTLGR